MNIRKGIRETGLVALAAMTSAVVVGIPCASATTIELSGAWTGTEALQGPNRLDRNGIPSVAGTAKTFPGTLANNPTYFSTLDFTAASGSLITVTGTATNSASTFFSIYDASFDPSNLSLNYLGDAGGSGANLTFSIFAPTDEQLVLVANSVGGTSAIGQIYDADVTFTAAAVPGPSSIAVLLAGLAAIGGAMYFGRRKMVATKA